LVAIKLLDPEIAASAHNLERFLREARAAATLRSPHVVQILDHGVDEGTPYIVMEQLEGESLAQRLERCHKLSPQDTARIVTHIARALARAHAARLVHRDLKPDNVFLVSNDDEEIAKLLDFGIAKSLREVKDSAQISTIPGVLVGTPYYMSPEQAEGASTIDHRADIWALGVIAFECLLGRRPFEGSTVPGLLIKICEQPQPIPSQEGPVPAGFDAWFARACARNASERFESAKQAATELRRLCPNESPRTPPASNTGATLVSAALSNPVAASAPATQRWPLAVGVALALCAAVFGARLLTRREAKPAATLEANTHPRVIPSLAGVALAARAVSVPAEGHATLPGPAASAPARVNDVPSSPSARSAPKVTLARAPTLAPSARQNLAASPPASAHSPTSAPSAPRPSSTATKDTQSSARTGVDLGI
jgi:serine/threonine-protein kinase